MSRIGRPFVSKTFADADSVRAQDLSYDGTDSIKAKIDSISGGGGEKISLTSQTIDSALNSAGAGTPAFFSAGTSSWKKSTSLSSTVTGLFVGSGEIVLFGRVTGLSGLTAGDIFWLADAGGLTSDVGNSTAKIKIGFAEATDVMLVDIDVESGSTSGFSGQIGSGDHHWTLKSNPFPSVDHRARVFSAGSIPNDAAETWNGTSWSTFSEEMYHVITIDGVDEISVTSTGGSASVGRETNAEFGLGNPFNLSTGGGLDRIVINLRDILGLAEPLPVIMEVRTGLVMDAGSLVLTDNTVSLDGSGTHTFDSFV